MTKASRDFQVMAKPVGALCNLACSYCYYLEKKELYPGRQSFRMSDEMLERYIVQHIEACPGELILFSWHGGEPTLLGIDYFRRVVELQRRHRPAGRAILNGIQTNGTLIDEDWAKFLAAEHFQVGLSIDGPKAMHDGFRITKGAVPTHKQVVQGFRLLKKHRVHCDILCVVHHKNVGHPAAVYQYFKDLGVEFLQFLPLVIREGAQAGPQSVPAEAYGTFLCTVFDEWVRNDAGRIAIQNFDEAVRPYLGVDHALCTFRETCGDVVVVEHNGDVYSCDHFVDREHRIGNLGETPLHELLEDSALRAFGRAKKDALPRACRECEVLRSCNGGCQKDRFVPGPDGESLNYLCSGYKSFFIHARPRLRQLAGVIQSGLPVQHIRDIVRSEQAAAALDEVGRNEPCPCGSGLKYKKCCLGKAPAAAVLRSGRPAEPVVRAARRGP